MSVEHVRSWELVEPDEDDADSAWVEITSCSCGAFRAEIGLSDEEALQAVEDEGPGLALFEQHANASPTLPLFD